MCSIADSSVVLGWLVGDLSSLCTTEMDLSITLLFVSKKSKHTLITPHGIGYSVWSSLIPSWLRLSRTVLVDAYISLVSTFCLHQTSSLHLELCFITRIISDLQTR